MEFEQVKQRALKLRNAYRDIEVKSSGTAWGFRERTEGLVADVGELMELVMAKSKLRRYKGDDLDGDIAHELADILWVTLVLADELDVDLEGEFTKNMDRLETKIKEGNK